MRRKNWILYVNIYMCGIWIFARDCKISNHIKDISLYHLYRFTSLLASKNYVVLCLCLYLYIYTLQHTIWCPTPARQLVVAWAITAICLLKTGNMSKQLELGTPTALRNP